MESPETIFLNARNIVDPGEQAAYLQNACGADAELRSRVEALLRDANAAEDYFSSEEKRSIPCDSLVTEAPGSIIGRYKLLEKIGEGGMGVVYMAEQREPVVRKVALKIIKPGMDTRQVIARFEAERQALALMDHPNIARVIDGGSTESGRPYFVMDLVAGLPITRFCDEARLSTHKRLELFREVCSAIQHAHQKGIIHRDLKPSNILVTLHGDNPVPKVIDFGIAKATQGRLTDKTLFTQFQHFIGTPAYMSPEQASLSGLDIDTRSDIYSLGVLLYELLTGKTPFDGAELLKAGFDEMRRLIREQEPARPSTRLKTLAGEQLTTTAQTRRVEPPKLIDLVRGDLDWIAMKCLEKDQARRYESASSLGADVQRHLNHEPVLARPSSNIYRFQRLVRRNRLAFAAGVAVSTALVLGVIGSMWQAARARRAEEQAKVDRDSANAILAFFQNRVLAAGRPKGEDGGLGKDVTLRMAIDAAEPKIAKTFRDYPLQEASVRDALGLSYIHLDEAPLAIVQLEQALALRRARLGPVHADTLRTIDHLGGAYHKAGKLDKALALKEETFKLREARLGPEHPLTVDAMNNLALEYQAAGKIEEGLKLYEAAFRLRKAQGGASHPETLRSMNNLGIALQKADKLDQALPLFEETLRLRQATLGPEHPDTLSTLRNLGAAYYEAGMLAKALPILEDTLRVEKIRLGPDHHFTLSIMNNLALAYEKNGNIEPAISLLEDALARQREKLEVNHPAFVPTLDNLARSYRAAGRLEKVLPLLEEALKIWKTRERVEHPSTLKRMHALAVFNEQAGNFEVALSLWEDILTAQRATLPAEHRDTLHTLEHLSSAYEQAGKLARAEKVLREYLALRGDTLTGRFRLGRLLLVLANSDTENTSRAQAHKSEGLQLLRDYLAGIRRRYTNDSASLETSLYDLAELHSRQRNYAEAEPLYRELLEKLRGRHSADHKTVLDATASLARLLADSTWTEHISKLQNARNGNADRAREAERLLRECLEVRSRGTNTPAWRLADTRSRLGSALLSVAVSEPDSDAKVRLSRLAETEALLLDAHEQLRGSRSGDPKYTRDALERVVRLYVAWDKPGKISEWQEKLNAFDSTHKQQSVPKVSEREP